MYFYIVQNVGANQIIGLAIPDTQTLRSYCITGTCSGTYSFNQFIFKLQLILQKFI